MFQNIIKLFKETKIRLPNGMDTIKRINKELQKSFFFKKSNQIKEASDKEIQTMINEIEKNTNEILKNINLIKNKKTIVKQQTDEKKTAVITKIDQMSFNIINWKKNIIEEIKQSTHNSDKYLLDLQKINEILLIILEKLSTKEEIFKKFDTIQENINNMTKNIDQKNVEKNEKHVTAIVPIETNEKHVTEIVPVETNEKHVTAIVPIETNEKHVTEIVPVETNEKHVTAIVPVEKKTQKSALPLLEKHHSNQKTVERNSEILENNNEFSQESTSQKNASDSEMNDNFLSLKNELDIKEKQLSEKNLKIEQLEQVLTLGQKFLAEQKQELDTLRKLNDALYPTPFSKEEMFRLLTKDYEKKINECTELAEFYKSKFGDVSQEKQQLNSQWETFHYQKMQELHLNWETVHSQKMQELNLNWQNWYNQEKFNWESLQNEKQSNYESRIQLLEEDLLLEKNKNKSLEKSKKESTLNKLLIFTEQDFNTAQSDQNQLTPIEVRQKTAFTFVHNTDTNQ